MRVTAARKLVWTGLTILLTAAGLFSAGNAFDMAAWPAVVDTLPGHRAHIDLFRTYASLDRDVLVRLESLDPEIAEVDETVVIPKGVRYVPVAVRALRPGTATILGTADQFRDVRFAVNVFDDPDPVVQAVDPESIRLRLAKDEKAVVPVSALVPPDAVPPQVDLAFTIDARPSFATAASRLAAATPFILDKLKTDFPSVSFAASVSKFQDYGGPGTAFRRLARPGPGSEFSRPYSLLLPMTRVDTAEGAAALTSAMGISLPGDAGLTIFASYLEALGQVAQGAGFDGDGNGVRTDSGLAGVAGDASTPGYLMPGPSGDVPPFASKPPSVPSAGTLGGVGFRAGSQRIALLATNTAPVSPFDRGTPFPVTIRGAKGVEVSSAVFQEVLAFPPPGTFPNFRYGSVSASVSAADPPNAVAPQGAMTMQEAFTLLAGQNVQVVPFFQLSEFAPAGGFVDPRPLLSNIARLTGGRDALGRPLIFELIGINAQGYADQIVKGISPILVQPRKVTLRAVGNDAGFGFEFTPAEVVVAPGDTAAFDVTITGTGKAGSFEIQFVTEDGVIIGRIPVAITSANPTITAIEPPRAPIGERVVITGMDFTDIIPDLRVTFAGIVAQVLSASETRIEAVVPAGSVAGPVDVVVAVSGQLSNPFPFTVLHTINSFSPTSGIAGTPFTILGNAFAPTPAGNRVTFGAVPAAITEASNTAVRGTVPAQVANRYPVDITTNTVTTRVGNFDLLPEVTGIVPNMAAGNAAVTINGGGFSPVAGDNAVTFTDRLTGRSVPAAVTAAGTTSLGTRVPADLTAGAHDVRVTVNGLSAAPVGFTVLPFITSVTPSFPRIGDRISISGTGFSPTPAENAVTLNGRSVPLLTGSSAATLLVTVVPGLSGASLEVVVTTRGVASNRVTVGLSQAPVILTQTIGTTTYEGVHAVFERRDRIVVRVSGADPNGDVTSASFVFRDGEGNVVGNFASVGVQSAVANQVQFVFSVPFGNSNHFTATMSVSVQLRDAAGNTSNIWDAKVINPDIRTGP